MLEAILVGLVLLIAAAACSLLTKHRRAIDRLWDDLEAAKDDITGLRQVLHDTLENTEQLIANDTQIMGLVNLNAARLDEIQGTAKSKQVRLLTPNNREDA